MRSVFVGAFDTGNPPDGAALAATVDGAVAYATHEALALAWVGSPAPVVHDHQLVFLDGEVYEVVGEGDGPVPVEALAALHRRLGDALLPRLRGDFVLVLHDARRRKLTIVRDQIGGRSVVWHQVGRRLRFATEVVDLLRVLPSRPAPDEVAVAHWLGVSGPPRDRSLYEGVHRLERAGRLDVDGAQAVVRRYWEPTYQRPVRLTLDEAAAGLRERLVVAARRRCAQPEATGVLLSGGLDSSSVAGMAGSLEPDRRPARAYSATFPAHPSVDESHLIELMCRHLGWRNTQVVVESGSVIGGALAYLEQWSLPPVSPNLFFWLPLLERARAEGTTILLDGEGGDELFGLSPMLLADRLRHGRVRAAAELVRQMPGGRPDLAGQVIRRFLVDYGLKGVVPLRAHRRVRRSRGGERYVPRWILPETAARFMSDDIEGEWKALRGPRWWAYLSHTVAAAAASTLAYDHVRRRGAMCGVEARHPLVDVDVIEHVLGLDPELAYDARYSRPVFREAVAGRVPDELRLRPAKSTFDAVFQESLTGPDLAVARDLLSHDPQVAAYVDLEAVERLLLADPPVPGGRARWAVELWRLINTECWLRVEAGRPLVGPRTRTLVAPTKVEVRSDPAAPGSSIPA